MRRGHPFVVPKARLSDRFVDELIEHRQEHYRRGKSERRAKTEYERFLHEHEIRNVLEARPHWLWPEVQAFVATLDPTDRDLLKLSLRDVGALARVASALSRGRWLLGPSLEVYARKPR